jgi:hypothetical protein
MRHAVRIFAAVTIGAFLATATVSAVTAASADSTPILTKTKADCAAEYQANLEAIKAAGQSKAAFDADCRAGTEKIPLAHPASASAAAKAKPAAPKTP